MSDIDGTICRIAPSPDQAEVPAETTKLLATLASRFSLVALLSGRCVSDMFRMVPLERIMMSGNHGLEWLCEGKPQEADGATGYRKVLEPLVKELRNNAGDGIFVEAKGLSISFHYRQATDREAARRRLLLLLEPLARGHRLRLLQGRMVIDLRPDCPLDKGTALEKLVRENGLSYVLIFGDDTTDIAAFEKLRELRDTQVVRGVSIGVTSAETGEALSNAADYLVGEPEDVVEILSELESLSSSASTT